MTQTAPRKTQAADKAKDAPKDEAAQEPPAAPEEGTKAAPEEEAKAADKAKDAPKGEATQEPQAAAEEGTKAAPAPSPVPMLRVLSQKPGFRRAGRSWTGSTEVPAADFTKAQIRQLEDEPKLVVQHFEAAAEEEGEPAAA